MFLFKFPMLPVLLSGLLGGMGAFSSPVVAAKEKISFFDAAVCQPTYIPIFALEEGEATQSKKKGHYDLVKPISKDGLTAREIVFGIRYFGILIDGLHADKLAQKYNLASDDFGVPNTANKGYSRPLPDQKQTSPKIGKFFIIASENPVFEGKTLLACEMIRHETLKTMKNNR